jgi:hypothetical protein
MARSPRRERAFAPRSAALPAPRPGGVTMAAMHAVPTAGAALARRGNRVLVAFLAGLLAPSSARAAVEIDARFSARLLEIAARYRSYRLTTRSPLLGPAGCAADVDPPGDPPRLSKSEDLRGHGQKLYHLFVLDGLAYAKLAVSPGSASGQVVVKEAWDAVKKPDGSLQPGPQASLFIMFRLDPKTPRTDGGWVYGPVTPAAPEQGKKAKVTSSGLVASCQGCHQKAPYDRLFGPK